MFTPIDGRTVLVTGGTKGIGKGIAGVFARAGANVVVNGRDAEAGEAAVRDLSGQGGEVAYVGGDVAKAADCERVAAETAARFGGIDVVCANAGVFPDVKLADMTEEDIDSIFATNVKGCMLTVKACLPHLERIGPRPRHPDELHHGPAHRLPRLVALRCDEGRAARLPPHRLHRARAEGDHGQRRHAGERRTRRGSTSSARTISPQMTASIPLGRLGKVEEIGAAALFLATDEAAYITGQTIVVDGGQIAPRVPGRAAVGVDVTVPAGMAPLGPAAAALRDRLLAEIAAGTPPPGERLGAERELAVRLGVSRSTLRAALDSLEDGRRRAPRAWSFRWDLRLPAARGARPHAASPGCPPTCAGRASSPAPVCSRPAPSLPTRRRPRPLALDEDELVLEVHPAAAGGRAARVARAGPLPGRSLPGLLDRSLAGSIYDLLETEYGLRGRRGRGADRGGRRRRRRTPARSRCGRARR